MTEKEKVAHMIIVSDIRREENARLRVALDETRTAILASGKYSQQLSTLLYQDITAHTLSLMQEISRKLDVNIIIAARSVEVYA